MPRKSSPSTDLAWPKRAIRDQLPKKISWVLSRSLGVLAERASRRLSCLQSLRPEVSTAAWWRRIVCLIDAHPLGLSFSLVSIKVVVVGTLVSAFVQYVEL